jgi:hypothetical protein
MLLDRCLPFWEDRAMTDREQLQSELESAERAARNEPDDLLAVWESGYKAGVESVRGPVDAEPEVIPISFRWSPEGGPPDDPDEEDRRPWDVTLEFRRVGGRLECVGFRIRSHDRRQPVTTARLREIRLATLVGDRRRKMLDALAGTPHPDHPGEPAVRMAPRTRQALSTGAFSAAAWTEQGKRPRYAPEHWEHVAAEYRRANSAGLNPTTTVQETFQVSYATAGHWVSRCRKKGLLGKAPKRGRAGEEKR